MEDGDGGMFLSTCRCTLEGKLGSKGTISMGYGECCLASCIYSVGGIRRRRKRKRMLSLCFARSIIHGLWGFALCRFYDKGIVWGEYPHLFCNG